MQIRWVGIVAVLLVLVVATTASAADKVVRVMTTETDPKTQAALKDIIAEFEKAHPGVNVAAEFASWSDINKKLLASLAAGDPPQIVTVHDFYIFELANKGIIRPVDDVIDGIGRADFLPQSVAPYTRDGKTWGVPFSTGVNVLWYRTDLYQKHGLKPPKTWAEYEHNAKVLFEAGRAAGKQEVYGTALAAGLNWMTEDSVHGWLWSNGATITDVQGRSTIDSPEAVDTFAFLKRIAQYAPPGIATYAHQEMINAFVTGASAHTEFGFRVLNHMERMNPKMLETSDAVVYPKGPSAKARHVTHLYQKGWAIIKDAKYQDESAEFLKFLETGSRKIRMMHSVPLHYWPPRRSVITDPAFLDNPLMKTPAGQKSLKVLNEALQVGMFSLTESGTTVLKVGPLLEGRVLSKALQRVLLQNVAPKDSVAQAAREVEAAK